MNDSNPHWDKKDFDAIHKWECVVDDDLKDLICAINATWHIIFLLESIMQNSDSWSFSDSVLVRTKHVRKNMY